MRRVVAAFQVWTVLVAVTAFAFPPKLGCCAGLVEAHGGGCCAASVTDAAARSCCEDEKALAPVPALHPALQLLTPAPGISLCSFAAALGYRGDEGPASLHDRGLYTLYRSLLI